MDRVLIPETRGRGRLGRHIVVDARNALFPADQAAQIVSVTHNSWGLPLNQLAVRSCTGEALVGALNTTPHMDYGQAPLTQADAYAIYHDETVLEKSPWPPNDPGGSGLEVCKAGKNKGWLRGYTHAVGINAALKALVVRPTISGINWFTTFDSPDANGVVSIGKRAKVRGGHEIVQVQIDAEKELVWSWQSWGLQFGRRGLFAMSFDTWDTLLQQGGDVTVPLTATGWNKAA